MDNFCGAPAIYEDPYFIFWIFLGVVVLLTFLLLRHFFRKTKNVFERIVHSFVSLFFFFVVFFTGTIFLATNGYMPFEGSYPNTPLSQMNAAIKNTCLVDPLKNNCPHNLVEVLRLYPEDFRKIHDQFALTYVYYPNENNYTLIARAKNHFMFTSEYQSMVAVFDQRLKGSSLPGGYDFINAPAYSCNGKYYLKNPPDFPGPWENIN